MRARLAKKDKRIIEASISQLKPTPIRLKKAEEKPLIARAMRPFVSNPREEYCLSLLLQYPELKVRMGELAPEYFESSENREIFTAWQASDDQNH